MEPHLKTKVVEYIRAHYDECTQQRLLQVLNEYEQEFTPVVAPPS
jgi:hypothetical protein